MNRLFVAYKPAQISSDALLSQIKKKCKAKKAGYSGTLDPFAKDVLVAAFNQCAKLFRFLDKNPKSCHATLWLGVKSLSLGTQNIKEIRLLKPFDYKQIQKACERLLGEISSFPPQFSAKRIEGERAYEFAKRGEIIPLEKCKMQVFSYEILHYTHSFLDVELKLSEGAYVRSWCELSAQKLEINATLSSLERLSEGEFSYNDEKSLDVLEYLNLKKNSLKDLGKLENGTKTALDELEIREGGEYFLEDEKFFSIIKINHKKVEYILNKVEKC